MATKANPGSAANPFDETLTPAMLAKIAYLLLGSIVVLGAGVTVQQVPAPDLTTSDTLIRWIVAFLILLFSGGVYWIVRTTVGKIPKAIESQNKMIQQQTKELQAMRIALERADIRVRNDGEDK